MGARLLTYGGILLTFGGVIINYIYRNDLEKKRRDVLALISPGQISRAMQRVPYNIYLILIPYT